MRTRLGHLLFLTLVQGCSTTVIVTDEWVTDRQKERLEIACEKLCNTFPGCFSETIGEAGCFDWCTTGYVPECLDEWTSLTACNAQYAAEANTCDLPMCREAVIDNASCSSWHRDP